MVDIIAALIGALVGGVVVAVVNNMFMRRKTQAEATHLIEQAASGVICDLQEQVKELKCDVAILKKKLVRAMSRINKLMGGIVVLLEQIRKGGDAPAWVPDEWDIEE
jgi:hypothetical protein